MTKQRVFKGWVGRTIRLRDIFWWTSLGPPDTELKFNSSTVYKTRDSKESWGCDEEWPPRKVKITVEFE